MKERRKGMKERAGVLSDGNTNEYDIECKQY